MATIQFETKILDINGWKIIRFPQNASEALSSRGMVMVKGAMNEIDFETILEPDGAGSHWFRVSDGLSKEAQAGAGDTVTLTVNQSDVWIEPDIPPDLLSSLASSDLQTQWDQLTTKARWEWIRWIRFTKNPSTRNKRIKALCSMLKAGKRRPCCFDYSRCTETAVSKSGVLLDKQES